MVKRISIRIALVMILVLTLWSTIFNSSVTSEVNNEIDGILDNYAENTVRLLLTGNDVPLEFNSTYISHSLETVTEEYANTTEHISYHNGNIKIKPDNKDIASRILHLIFKDSKDEYWLLKVSTPTVDSEELMAVVTVQFTILFVAILLCSVLTPIVMLRQGMAPLYKILQWIESGDIAKGVVPLELDKKAAGELVRLKEAIVDAAIRSQEVYNYQRQIVGNASHELQTPIAICKYRLDLLIKTPLNEEQLATVGETQSTLHYMSRLVNELLTLTKINGGQYINKQLVNITDLVELLIEDYQEIYEAKEFTFTVEKGSAPIEVTMNDVLARLFVANILRNAFIHNNEQGIVRVDIKGSKLTISNSGKNEELLEGEIFEIFYRDLDKAGSTGLGLAIVKAISDSYCFPIKYAYVDNLHTFTINFEEKA